MPRAPIVNPTDCAFLPNGDLLVLERGVALFSLHHDAAARAAADVRPGDLMRGEILLDATGGDIDNMEALAVHTGPAGDDAASRSSRTTTSTTGNGICWSSLLE